MLSESEYVQGLDCLARGYLVDLVTRVADRERVVWAAGGPEDWSRDELVNALVRVRRGEPL